MLNPIEIAYQTGATLYCVIHNKDGTVWNNNTQLFESFTPSNWGYYAVALTEQGSSGYYRGTFPSAIGSALTTECTYNQQGGSPAIDPDAQAGPISIGQSQGSDIAAVVHNETAASNMQVNLSQLMQGSVISGTISTTQAPTNLISGTANLYTGRLLIFTSGALAQEVATITGYSGAGGILYFSATTSAPAPGDMFLIV